MKLIPAFLLLYLVVSGGIAPAFADTPASLATPPVALEKWYKPANKRQVWLHTMFRLRREMQAIREYAKQNDRPGMEKWITRLEKDYNKIADMVPEWEEEIKPRLLPELEMFAEKGDTSRVGKTLKMIQRTCDDCHDEYQPLVTAIYRSPYYDDIQVKDANGIPQSFEDNMEDLSPRERILGKATLHRLEALQTGISEGHVKDSQKLMGEIAVTVCARCHNTHRIVYDLRNALLPGE